MEVSDEILADAVAAANEQLNMIANKDYDGEVVDDMEIAREDIEAAQAGVIYDDALSAWSWIVVGYVKSALKYSGKAP